jgi:hypothetical protein
LPNPALAVDKSDALDLLDRGADIAGCDAELL